MRCSSTPRWSGAMVTARQRPRSIACTTNTGNQQLAVTTKAGTKSVDKVVWAVYRDVNSLDPVYAFDYPENTTDSLLYESLLRQAPDGSIGPGLASLNNPDPTTYVF